MEQHIRKPAKLLGRITPPADKSVSHRSLILNSIAEGRAHVSNFLPAADCLSTLSCLQALGMEIERRGTEVTVTGKGLKGFREPSGMLDAGNSGTTIRLLSGLLAAQPFRSTITGDDSLKSRPMGRVIEPLTLMGATIKGHQGTQKAPLTITGGHLQGIDYKLPMASAQVKSAILIAGLFASGETRIEEPALSRDHTERMLRAMGADIKCEGLTITLDPPTSPLAPLTLRVPADISSAAFWLIAGAIHPNAQIRLQGVGINPTRSGILDLLQSMGASFIIDNQRLEGDEPVADIQVESSSLKASSFGGEMIPRLIDEIPVIAVAAAVAKGTTTIRDAGELRVKESDRIKTTVTELAKLGAQIEELPDGMVIHGVPKLKGTRCDSHGDHRLAMALAVAGLIAEGETIIA
ncbi:MAG: 3-phosphoshikimate 1-carboxyvinyltransferase, partial [Chloroflexi bacterium]|nr:3-phosphoshikimate 1-carboxyvinyltransferase [Chloroflexota bacterium]